MYTKLGGKEELLLCEVLFSDEVEEDEFSEKVVVESLDEFVEELEPRCKVDDDELVLLFKSTAVRPAASPITKIAITKIPTVIVEIARVK